MSQTQGYVRKPEVNIVLHLVARLVLWILGWKIVGKAPNVPKVVIIAAPHTANIDGFLMVMAAWYVRAKLDWMVKAELTRGPLGWIVRAAGGVPVDRSASFDAVDQMVKQFSERDELALAISPEGTRKKRDHWKTGFYWIAHRANVPILCATVDYGKKVIDISAPFIHTTGDIEADMPRIWDHYRNVTARFPEKVNEFRLRGTGMTGGRGSKTEQTGAEEHISS
jgi:1-acyl-sn-glycerol-3-phosphate acyltransferase